MAKTQKEIANEIRAEFARLGMSIAQVADILKTSPASISNYLCGSKIGTNMARRMNDAFGFSEVFLVTGAGTLYKEPEPEKQVDTIERLTAIVERQQTAIEQLTALVEKLVEMNKVSTPKNAEEYFRESLRK